MGCFDNLVQSQFLHNVANEINTARTTLECVSETYSPTFFHTDENARKKVYDQLVKSLNIEEEMSKSIVQNPNPLMIFCMYFGDFLFFYGKRKKQIEGTLIHNYYVNGYVPYHRSRHKINNTIVYTALIDMRIGFISDDSESDGYLI